MYDPDCKYFSNLIKTMHTDPLCVNIQTEDVYKEWKYHFHSILDYSNFPDIYLFYDISKKDILGVLKHETIESTKLLVGLRSKLYTFEYSTNSTYKKNSQRSKKQSNESSIILFIYRNFRYA